MAEQVSLSPSLPLTCHLTSANTSQAIVCDIKETEVGKYSVSFTPSACGDQVEDIIDGSPFSLHVVPSRSKPVKIISGFNKPCGVAVDKNRQLIVAEYGNHCITVYDKKGKKIRSFGSEGTKEGQFIKPRGVAVTNDGHILVTDNHRLQKLTLQGQCVMSVGSSEAGSGPLQFNCPDGVAIHPITGQIHVADSNSHRIQVINDDFTYSHSIGMAPGQLSHPSGVALDAAGSVYVANTDDCCVDVFASDGRRFRRFGSEGSEVGQLKVPVSITIDQHDMVYVTESDNHRVSIYTTGGKFVRCIDAVGEDEFNVPYGITVDTLGNLYVSDLLNNRIVVL